MASGTKPLTFEEFAQRLSDIFDEVEAQGEQITVERGGKLFTLRLKRRRVRKTGKLTFDNSLFDIIGIGHSEGPTDVSSNKHKYIADAIASHFENRAQESPEDSTAPDAVGDRTDDCAS